MQSIDPSQLTIYQFSPDNIIMIHKYTKQLYQYFQTPIIAFKQNHIFHNHLLQASFLPTGILYKKQITSMLIENNKRMKSTIKHYYEQEELVNTFLPILQCLQYLHTKEIVHGSLCQENIIFNEEGEVLLRDWLLERPNNKYYDVEKISDRKWNDDLLALGLILLETSSFIEIRPQTKNLAGYQNSLKKLAQKYSRGYILAIYVMLRKIQKFYPNLQKLLQNNQVYIQSSQQLISMYKKLKGQKQLKQIITPNLLQQTNFKYIQCINKTPLITKKHHTKIDDVQNKKNYVRYDDTKKKNIERVSKIAEKFIQNQLGSSKKPDMALKKMSNLKINIQQFNQLDQQKSFTKKTTKQEVLKFGYPLKRLKTVSKKKSF